MDWLKDKKNTPIVATVAAVIIVAVCIIFYMNITGSKSSAPVDTASSTAGPTVPGGPSGAPGAAAPSAEPAGNPSAPAPGGTPEASSPSGGAPDASAAGQPGTASSAGAATSGKTETASVKPMERWRSDPFLPIGYKPPKKIKHRSIPHIVDFPFLRLPSAGLKKNKADMIPDPVQPVRRMAGLMINDRVFAIIESNGKSEIVQPGDVLSDRLATVEKIEKDKVVLKTTTRHPKYIVIRMAASARQRTDNSQNNGYSGNAQNLSSSMPGVPRGNPGGM